MNQTASLLTMKQSAPRLGLTVRALQRRIRLGQIPAVKIGRLLMMKESDLQAFIAGLHTTGDLAAVDTEDLNPVNGTSVDERAEHMTRKVIIRHMTMSASAAIHRGFEFMDNLSRLDHPQPEFAAELDTAIRAMGQLREYLGKIL